MSTIAVDQSIRIGAVCRNHAVESLILQYFVDDETNRIVIFDIEDHGLSLLWHVRPLLLWSSI
jgi:hypothetical protein